MICMYLITIVLFNLNWSCDLRLSSAGLVRGKEGYAHFHIYSNNIIISSFDKISMNSA